MIRALTTWRAEIAAGVAGQSAARPGSWRWDSLFRAACADANAVDDERMGLVHAAAEWRATSRRIILAAARQRVA